MGKSAGRPIKDRTNELDQLQSKNRNDIHDVDSRATAGINKAMMAANTADQHAQDAANRANQAKRWPVRQAPAPTLWATRSAIWTSTSRCDGLEVPFAAGHTTLGQTAKSDLDDMATKLAGEKGYIIEVQGYSRSGVHTSQAMADAVVRYLVTEHQVPVYRIYKYWPG